MRWSQAHISALLISFGLSIVPCMAIRNITIDDTDPRIQYSPALAWERAQDITTADRSAGTTTFAFARGAQATFRFQGSAIYFMSYGLLFNEVPAPGVRNFEVELDGRIETSSLAASFVSQKALYIAYRITGLDPLLEHQITVRNTLGLPFNVDAFIVTVDEDFTDVAPVEGTPPTTTPIVSGPSFTTFAQPTVSGSTPPLDTAGLSNIAAIMAGVLGGLFLAICVGLGAFYLRRKRDPPPKDKGDMAETGQSSIASKPILIEISTVSTSDAQPTPPPTQRSINSRSSRGRGNTWDTVTPYYTPTVSTASRTTTATTISSQTELVAIKQPTPDPRPVVQYPTALVTGSRRRDRERERDRGRRALSVDDKPITNNRQSIMAPIPPPYVN